jgi:pimeloyl-ACP methyl ester carboxylesterase
VRLAGTLYLPAASAGPVPAVVLLHGSGQMGRLQNSGNRVLYNHAEWLAEHGIAVLFFDKRGVGESSGAFRTAGFDLLTDDAAGGIALLRRHPRIDPARVGALGLSQGAWIATQLLERDASLAFVISVTGGAPVTPAEQEVFVQTNALTRAGANGQQVADALSVLQRAFQTYRADAGWDALDRDRERLSREPWAKSLAVAQQSDAWWRWYRSFMDYDPRPVLLRSKAPVFAALGTADALFDVAAMQREWQTIAARPAGGVTVKAYTDVGHALRRGSGTDQPVAYWSDLEQWLNTILSKK